MTSSNDQTPVHEDFQDNKAEAMRVIAEHKKLPHGLRMYMNDVGFGLSYRHPDNAPGHHTGELIGFNQSYHSFVDAANDSCNFFYKMAKRMQRYYGRKSSITDVVEF